MKFLERAVDEDAVCPLCAAIGGVEFNRIPRWAVVAGAMPLVGMLFWTNGRFLWRILISKTTVVFLVVPTFGRCASCKASLQKKAFGSGWVHHS
jgi:hypothetical protein